MPPSLPSLQHIEQLPSARLPSRWAPLLRPAAQFAALIAVCAAVHSFGRAVSVVGSLAVGLAAAAWGLRRDSLNLSGATSVSRCRQGPVLALPGLAGGPACMRLHALQITAAARVAELPHRAGGCPSAGAAAGGGHAGRLVPRRPAAARLLLCFQQDHAGVAFLTCSQNYGSVLCAVWGKLKGVGAFPLHMASPLFYSLERS